MAANNSVELGDEVKDAITGFTGIVVGITKWLHGCRRMAVQPRELKDGKPIDPVSFDEPQLQIVKRAQAETTSRTGGPGPNAPRRPDARR